MVLALLGRLWLGLDVVESVPGLHSKQHVARTLYNTVIPESEALTKQQRSSVQPHANAKPFHSTQCNAMLSFSIISSIVSFITYKSLHIHNTANTLPRSHRPQTLIHLRQRIAVRDELVDLQLIVLVVLYQPSHLRAALDAAESAAFPRSACY